MVDFEAKTRVIVTLGCDKMIIINQLAVPQILDALKIIHLVHPGK